MSKLFRTAPNAHSITNPEHSVSSSVSASRPFGRVATISSLVLATAFAIVCGTGCVGPEPQAPSGTQDQAASSTQTESSAATNEALAELRALYEREYAIDTTYGYTQDSVDAHRAALDTAVAGVLDGASPTSEQVTAASDAIVNASSLLEYSFDPAEYEWASYEQLTGEPEHWVLHNVGFWGRVLRIDVMSDDVLNVYIASDGADGDVAVIICPIFDWIAEGDFITSYGSYVGMFDVTFEDEDISIPGQLSIVVHKNA